MDAVDRGQLEEEHCEPIFKYIFAIGKRLKNQVIMALNFNKYINDGEHFVNEVAKALGQPQDKVKAGHVLRAVLHTLRNRLTPNESLQLIAQLPMLIKAVYVDGWRITNEARELRHLGDFIEAVREAGGSATRNDFVTDYETEAAIRAVFRVIRQFVSDGEIADILATLPAELKPLLEDR